MALSRIVLGVHYPSDVAFGVALGAAVARLALWLESVRDGGVAG
jgi:membrane-associated phospholipid phosphatase